MFIGIDLGTTNSAITSFDGKNTRVWKSPEQNDVTPSVIYIAKRGGRFYGKKAYDNAPLNPENTAQLFKRLMGSSTKIKVADIEMTPEECSAEILRTLFGYLPEDVRNDKKTGTVITVPAAFNQMQKNATKEAAFSAGINKVALIQEPVAAIMSVAKQQNINGLFVVYDFGGGTFDVSIAERTGNKINLLTNDGIAFCGGRDFDKLLLDNIVVPWLKNNFNLPESFRINEKYAKLIRMATWATEQAKIELSAKETASVQLDESVIRCLDESGNEIYLDAPLSREQYNNLIFPKIDETIEKTREVISNVGLKPEDINYVVFVGGPTQYKPLRDRVSQQLGIAPSTDVNPMTAVSEGAAIYAESVDFETAKGGQKADKGIIKAQSYSLEFRYNCDHAELLDDINAAREGSGFVKIEDNTTIIKAVDDLRNDCLQSANNYLDNLKENSLVGVFNQIVKIDEYESFFVDELIAHYELIISESLQKKENECRDSFESIEKTCNSFNDGSSLSSSLKAQISVFADKLKSWDNYAQPLQVNMQRHGGQHKSSEQLLRDLRNKVIDLCNKSQEVLGNMLNRWNNAMKQYAFSTAQNIKKQINNKIPDSLGLVEGLISIINIFQSVFAELDMDSERLAKDKKDLSELKKSLAQLNESAQAEKRRQIQAQEAKEQASKNCRIAHGVFAIISFIIMIICFACGSVGGGVAFIFITVAFGICCAAYPYLKGRKIMKWIVIIGIMFGGCIGTAVNSNNTSHTKFEGTLNSNNFEEVFKISSSVQKTSGIYYSIEPKSENYAKSTKSSSIIKVTIEYRFSGGAGSGTTGTESITLYKSSGYKSSGFINIYGSFTYKTYTVKAIFVSGYVYLE